MKEITIRKYHRYLGLVLFLFLVVQTFTGLLFSLQGLTMPPLFRLSPFLRSLHYGGGTPGDIYRILLALGILLQGILGVVIWWRIHSRKKT
ncbi:MAG: hypothetical protein ACLFQR_11210 [Desulfovibrionales bacterium]